jgi:hypothetical protein
VPGRSATLTSSRSSRPDWPTLPVSER